MASWKDKRRSPRSRLVTAMARRDPISFIDTLIASKLSRVNPEKSGRLALRLRPCVPRSLFVSV